eukprot:UN19226
MLLTWALQRDNSTVLTVCFGVFGFLVMPLLPVVLESGVECTYPVPEEYSTGLLMAAGNLTTLPLVFSLSAINDDVTGDDDGFLTSNVKRSFVITYGFGVAFLMAFNGEYKRLNAERRAKDPLLNSPANSTPRHSQQFGNP